jgi:hypothetical protein
MALRNRSTSSKVLLLAAAVVGASAQQGAPTGLLTDLKRAPALGVRLAPAFAWIVPSCAAGGDSAQTAFRVVVTRADGGATVWDSGRVASNESTYALYAGPALAPATRYAWAVSTWSASCASPASAPAAFVTAPWAGFDAAAQFITTPTAATFGYFRREIAVPAAGVASAVAFVAAYVDVHLLCGYKLYINDQLVNVGPGRGEAPVAGGGDGVFRGLPITTLDVTAAINSSAGAAAALALQTMHAPPSVIFQLELTLADGSVSRVVTDASWRAFDGDAHRKPGPAMDGGSAGTAFVEYIDARGEPVGWRAAGYSEGPGWAAAAGAAPSAEELANLYPRMESPMVVDELLRVASLQPVPSQPIPPGAACGIVPNHAVFYGACPNGSAISGVTFASFGNPTGSCSGGGGFTKGVCDANTSLAVLEAACVGQTYCEVLASKYAFGGSDPCPQFSKSLAVQLACPQSPGPPPPPPVRSSFLATFEKEFEGGLRLDVENGVAGSVVEITCGEHVTNGSIVDSAWGWAFKWTLRDGAQTLEQHKYMECRFALLTFTGLVPAFTLSAWRVAYEWADEDSMFSSSNATLDAVYDLCRYTVFSAALDTYTDSNTRERTPYEADGLISASGRIAVQREYLFPRHSHSFVLTYPTWPLEWKMLTPFLAFQDYMATGRADLALAFEERLHNNTMLAFLEPSTGLIRTDLTGSEGSHIIDWMPDGNESDQSFARGEMTNSSHLSVTNGMAAQGLALLAQMMEAGGRLPSAARYAAESAALAAAIDRLMWLPASGTFCDGVCAEVGNNSRLMTSMYFLAFGLAQQLHGAPAVDAAWRVVAGWGINGIGDYGAFWWQAAIASSYYAPYYPSPASDDGTAMLTALTKDDYYSWVSGLRDDNLTMTRESWHAGTYSHGWGTSPLLGITWGLMGVHQLEPAWASFLVAPKLGSLANATIRVPTIRGFINVTAAPAAVDVQVPCNSVATLCAPRSAADGVAAAPPSAATHALFLDGVEQRDADFARVPGHACVARGLGCAGSGRAWELRLRRRG